MGSFKIIQFSLDVAVGGGIVVTGLGPTCVGSIARLQAQGQPLSAVSVGIGAINYSNLVIKILFRVHEGGQVTNRNGMRRCGCPQSKSSAREERTKQSNCSHGRVVIIFAGR